MSKKLKRGRKPISKENLLKDLLRVANEVNTGMVGINQYKKLGSYSVEVYSRNFGSWNKAVIAIKLKPYHPFTEKELLDDLIRVAKEIKPALLTLASYNLNGKYAQNTYSYRFGSWAAAIKKAGLESASKNKIVKKNRGEVK